jgi:hypothetical protein
MAVKTAPVSIYIDDVLVGSGELAYNDMSSPVLTPLTVHHCDDTPVHVDGVTVPLLLCWDDMVSTPLGGVTERELNTPVYVNGVKVGSATVKLIDSHSSSLITVLLAVVMIWLLVDLITCLVTGTKRGEIG